jgi:hypothetical protein
MDQLNRLCEDAVKILKQSHELPPPELQSKVDQVENLLARLRDSLIQRVRSDQTVPVSRFKDPLDRVNITISLIAGLVYPNSRFQREYIADSIGILDRLRSDLQREGEGD